MFAKSTIAAVALLAGFVAAQGSTANSTIDPTTVSDTVKCESIDFELRMMFTGKAD